MFILRRLNYTKYKNQILANIINGNPNDNDHDDSYKLNQMRLKNTKEKMLNKYVWQII